jgi:uncharacterized membrane protein
VNGLHLLAYYHRGYGYAGGWSSWIAHIAVMSMIHAVIYGVVFRLMHRLTLGEDVVLAAFVLFVVFMLGRASTDILVRRDAARPGPRVRPAVAYIQSWCRVRAS